MKKFIAAVLVSIVSLLWALPSMAVSVDQAPRYDSPTIFELIDPGMSVTTPDVPVPSFALVSTIPIDITLRSPDLAYDLYRAYKVPWPLSAT